MQTYKISPAPYVVELDLMTQRFPTGLENDETPAPTLGKLLQDLLANMTGRRNGAEHHDQRTEPRRK